MSVPLLVRFRPAGPWRIGAASGSTDRVDPILGSDALYSALTLAMRDLGWMDEWLAITSRAPEPFVRITSCFPYVWRTLLIAPPRNLWPPAQMGKVRWSAARFVPVPVVRALLRDENIKEERWSVDPASQCLLPAEKSGMVTPPFRLLHASAAPVDRVSAISGPAQVTTGVQFAAGAGMWFAAVVDGSGNDQLWRDRLKSACRLLADTGIGGKRSRGWGRCEEASFEDTSIQDLLLRDVPLETGAETAYWLLSLFSPAKDDTVDWGRGNYGIVTRSGRVHATGQQKLATRMVSEGSVLLSAAAPKGTARDVAPEGSPHPVYRAGFAFAVPVPWRETHRQSWLGVDRAPEAAEPQSSAELPERVEPEPEVRGAEETPPEPEIALEPEAEVDAEPEAATDGGEGQAEVEPTAAPDEQEETVEAPATPEETTIPEESPSEADDKQRGEPS